jgi:hypothetical protein
VDKKAERHCEHDRPTRPVGQGGRRRVAA